MAPFRKKWSKVEGGFVLTGGVEAAATKESGPSKPPESESTRTPGSITPMPVGSPSVHPSEPPSSKEEAAEPASPAATAEGSPKLEEQMAQPVVPGSPSLEFLDDEECSRRRASPEAPGATPPPPGPSGKMIM